MNPIETRDELGCFGRDAVPAPLVALVMVFIHNKT